MGDDLLQNVALINIKALVQSGAHLSSCCRPGRQFSVCFYHLKIHNFNSVFDMINAVLHVCVRSSLDKLERFQS